MEDEKVLVEVLEEKEEKPLILILEDGPQKFGNQIYKEISKNFKVLLYKNYCKLIMKINSILCSNEKLHSVIIYKALMPSEFLQFWSFICSGKHFSNLRIFYYFNNIIFGFQGNKRIFAHPLFKINDVNLQIGLILDLIQLKNARIA